jgi:hypothetical protein
MGSMRGGAGLFVPFLAAVVLAACGSGDDYRVIVRFADESLAARADRIELALLGSCGDVALGEPPPEQARRLEVVATEPPAAFGEVEPGMRGLYARAFDADACALIAAGCSPIELERGGGGELVVVLEGIAETRCPGGTACVAGSCMPVGVEPDAGPTPDAGPRPDAGPGVDSGTVVPPPGERWVDVPCMGTGDFCGDSLTGVYGTCQPTTSGPRCCAGCYDRVMQRCEPGTEQAECGWRGLECERCGAGQICAAFPPLYQCR